MAQLLTSLRTLSYPSCVCCLASFHGFNYVAVTVPSKYYSTVIVRVNYTLFPSQRNVTSEKLLRALALCSISLKATKSESLVTRRARGRPLTASSGAFNAVAFIERTYGEFGCESRSRSRNTHRSLNTTENRRSRVACIAPIFIRSCSFTWYAHASSALGLRDDSVASFTGSLQIRDALYCSRFQLFLSVPSLSVRAFSNEYAFQRRTCVRSARTNRSTIRG